MNYCRKANQSAVVQERKRQQAPEDRDQSIAKRKWCAPFLPAGSDRVSGDLRGLGLKTYNILLELHSARNLLCKLGRAKAGQLWGKIRTGHHWIKNTFGMLFMNHFRSGLRNVMTQRILCRFEEKQRRRMQELERLGLTETQVHHVTLQVSRHGLLPSTHTFSVLDLESCSIPGPPSKLSLPRLIWAVGT